jgi:hypothetical protein
VDPPEPDRDADIEDVSAPPDATRPDTNRPDLSQPDAGRDADVSVADADATRGDADASLRDADAAISDADASSIDADAGRLDTGLPDADASLPDVDAPTLDADARIPDVDAGLPDVTLDVRLDVPLDITIDVTVDADATPDADATVDADAATPDADVTADADATTDADATADADGGDAGPHLLRSARNFAIIASSTITIAASPPPVTVFGDVGTFPGTAVDAFPPGQPVGSLFAGGPVALQAQSDVTIAYNTLAGMPCNANQSSVDLGGLTLAPAVYCFDTSAGLTGALVLDAQGDPNAVWVFQVGSTLTTATDSTVTVINGGSACNVYWQVGSSATLGIRTAFLGNILAEASITMVTNSSLLTGRVFARSGAVALDGNAISTAGCH